jgi:mono/diheme cytochrome c family protein
VIGCRWFSQRIVLAALAAWASGCARPEGRPVRSDQVTDFSALYGQHCAGCHGVDGRLGPAPPLNDPLFLAIVPDDVLLQVVSEGRAGTPMPAFSRKHGGALTDEQVRALAAGLRARWKAKPPEVEPPAYLADEKAHAGDPRRGATLFERACASCHGEGGHGGEKKVGPINNDAFLALISDQAVRRYIITGRQDLGMPDFASKQERPKDFHPLSEADVADLVALVARWRGSGEAGRAGVASSR